MNGAPESGGSADIPGGGPRPVLLYDGACAFCTAWARRCVAASGQGIDSMPYQEAAARFPHIPVADLEAAVHLVASDGTVHRGARALFQAAGTARRWRWLPWAYRALPGFAPISEAVYRAVARHRHRSPAGPGLQ